MRLGRACLHISRALPQLCRLATCASETTSAILRGRALTAVPLNVLLTLIALIALTAAPALAQAPTPAPTPTVPGPARTMEVRGWLRMAANNQAVEMIKVELKRITGEPVGTTFTSSTGEFEFGGLSSGTYYVEVSEKGYEPVRESVDLRHSARQIVMLYLREPVRLGEKPPEATAVSARELALPARAAEALGKGKAELFERNNPGGSLKHFQKLAKEAPDFYEAYFYLGLAFTQLGRADEAEAALRKAIAASNETHAASYVSLASLLTGQERYADAAPLARKGAELDPDAWQGHYELARALIGMGQANEALKAAQAASEKRADMPDLQLLLANIHMRRGDARGLLAALDGYLKLQPEGPMSEQVRATRSQLLADLRRAHGLPAQPTPTPPPPL